MAWSGLDCRWLVSPILATPVSTAGSIPHIYSVSLPSGLLEQRIETTFQVVSILTG
jgi:hypothetical protein